jgi:uncharacterized Zn finger protein
VSYYGYEWRPYVPVWRRRMQAEKKMAKLRKKGLATEPVEIDGRLIARTFWGSAWCEHLEKFSDFENRLPRGRSYVRNGSVCHLGVDGGHIKAYVSGSELYTVDIKIDPLPPKTWKAIKGRCAGQIGSIIELLSGKLSGQVMAVVTDRDRGLFPSPKEIHMNCSCPDWAVMCKHVAAVLYGIGARLDEKPELLFVLRGVDHQELIAAEVDVAAATGAGRAGGRRRLEESSVADVFGIEIEKEAPAGRPTAASVTALRERFKMTQSQFAKLLGVSAYAISIWQRKPGPLRLQTRTLAAYTAAVALSSEEAWDRLTGPKRGRRAKARGKR